MYTTDTLFDSLPNEFTMYLKKFRKNRIAGKAPMTFIAFNEDGAPYEQWKKNSETSYLVLMNEELSPDDGAHCLYTLRKMRKTAGFIAESFEAHYDDIKAFTGNGKIEIFGTERDGTPFNRIYDISRGDLASLTFKTYLGKVLSDRYKTKFPITSIKEINTIAETLLKSIHGPEVSTFSIGLDSLIENTTNVDAVVEVEPAKKVKKSK